jgi:RNA polymerase sigma-70 factor (ECF subfamily)
LRRARGGDSEALEALCRRYMPLLQRWATGRLPRAARERFDTGDLVQEVLFKALRHIEDFEPRHEGAFQVYLRKTLHNLIKDEIRRIRIHPRPSALGDDAVHPGPSPLEIAVGKELSERYEAALEKLKPEEREAIILRIEFNRSYQEIAEAMRKPSVDAARMAVSRALVRLARELKDAGVER